MFGDHMHDLNALEVVLLRLLRITTDYYGLLRILLRMFGDHMHDPCQRVGGRIPPRDNEVEDLAN